MKINTLDLTHLELPEFYEFSERFIKLVTKAGAAQLKIEALYNNIFIKAFQKFDDSYKIIRKSSLTQKIKELDKVRDKITSSMIGTVKVSLNDMNQEVAEAAKELKILFDDFKGITQERLKKQTGDTTNLIQLLKGKYAVYSEKVGLEKWLTELERLNEEIRSIMHVRSEERGEKGKANAGEAKKKVISAYRMICSQIEIYVVLEGASNYEFFIRTLNAIISEFGRKQTSAASASSTDDSSVAPPAQTPEETKYPNAKEWVYPVPEGTFALGDICFRVNDKGERLYFELIDEVYYDLDPIGEEAHYSWKPLN